MFRCRHGSKHGVDDDGFTDCSSERHNQYARCRPAGVGCASSRNIDIVVVFPRFGAFMRRNLGLCQIVHLRCTVVNSSPKLGEVPEGRRSVFSQRRRVAHAPGPAGHPLYLRGGTAGVGCASSRNINIVVVFPRFGAFMRRNLGLCQLVHLRCTVVKSSPKLGEVPEGRRSV